MYSLSSIDSVAVVATLFFGVRCAGKVLAVRSKIYDGNENENAYHLRRTANGIKTRLAFAWLRLSSNFRYASEKNL